MKLRVAYNGDKYFVQFKPILFWHILREGWKNWRDLSFYTDFCRTDKMIFNSFEEAYNEANAFKFNFSKRLGKNVVYKQLKRL